MNIFILCTGRCGSTTFIKAASHITNFTSGHESRASLTGNSRFAYPLHHIEADNRLSWLLGRLDLAYGSDAYYVHLQRDLLQTAQSFRDRWDRGIMKAYRTQILMTATNSGTYSEEDKLIYSIDYCETVNSNIKAFLKDKPNKMDFYLENAENNWKMFWDWIKAEGSLGTALEEWKVKYNARVVA